MLVGGQRWRDWDRERPVSPEWKMTDGGDGRMEAESMQQQ